MSEGSTENTQQDFYGKLCWGLRRLAMWGESADPHVRYEAKTQAKTTLGELARQVETEEAEVDVR